MLKARFGTDELPDVMQNRGKLIATGAALGMAATRDARLAAQGGPGGR